MVKKAKTNQSQNLSKNPKLLNKPKTRKQTQTTSWKLASKLKAKTAKKTQISLRNQKLANKLLLLKPTGLS